LTYGSAAGLPHAPFFHTDQTNAVVTGEPRGFRLESLRARSKGCVMKIILALCFTALCWTTAGQTAKPFFPRDVWLDYMTISKKIVQLETRIKSISLATLEKKGLARLQGQAQKISSDEAYQAEREADKNWAYKTEPVRTEIARLKLKQQNLDNLYVMPVAAPIIPKPAKKPKP
jgi:hypothetical protein